MLLEHVSMRQLARWLKPHLGKAAWPGLDGPRAVPRMRQWMKRMGTWRKLGQRVDPARPIEVLPRSLYREYARTGIREGWQDAHSQRQARLIDAAMALWLDHPAADLDLVQDLIWAVCEMSTWTMPAHEYVDPVELGSTRVGVELAEIRHLLRDRLEDDVAERIDRELRARMLDPASDLERVFWWSTAEMNWNHVCNANLITIALYQIKDPDHLARFLHPHIQRMDYALNGFAPDGGCLEGPAYWQYGFGHFVDAAVVMHHRTGGKVNLMADPRVEPICRYPLAATIDPPIRAAFADGGHGYLQPGVVLAVNHLVRLPDLYALAAHRSDKRLNVTGWRELALYHGEKAGTLKIDDHVLPHLGLGRIVGGTGAKRTIVAAMAGSNGVPHNHNDIGSYILYRSSKCLLTDPGAPRYTAQTFGPRRYELFQCRALGHSVPLINGVEQQPGGKYRATIELSRDNATGTKALRIDMSKAYPIKSLKSLVRTIAVDKQGGVMLSDAYQFSAKPRALEEAFITFEDAKVQTGGRSVQVGKGKAKLTLRADAATPGRFRVDEHPEAMEHGHAKDMVRRIVFTPKSLSRMMTMRFEMD